MTTEQPPVPTHEEIAGQLAHLGGDADALTLGNAVVALGHAPRYAQLGMQRAADAGAIVYGDDFRIRLPAGYDSPLPAAMPPAVEIVRLRELLLRYGDRKAMAACDDPRLRPALDLALAAERRSS